MIDAVILLDKFFDSDGNPILNSEGKPKAGDTKELREIIERVPYNQSPNVTKLFELSPAHVGVMFSGAALVGDKSIRNLIDEFLDDSDVKKYFDGDYVISKISERLKDFIQPLYNDAYEKWTTKPTMDILVSGYSKRFPQPEIFQITLDSDGAKAESKRKRGEYGTAFGGQTREIRRVVNGLDVENYISFMKRMKSVTDLYRDKVLEILSKAGVDIEIPWAKDIEGVDIYGFDWIEGIQTDYSNFSEQAAIDFVDFLVDIMIKSQQFSNRLPTVGGDIHLALITKSGGFRWISQEAFTYKGREVRRHEPE